MPRKRKAANPRHPADAMAKFDRLILVMAPKMILPEPLIPKELAPRGKRRKPKVAKK